MSPSTPSPASPSDSRRPHVWVKLAAGVLVGVVIVVTAFVVGNALTRPTHQAAKLPADLAPAEVTITSTGFVPSTISVKTGQAVIWTDADAASHGVVANSSLSGLASQQHLAQGDSLSYVFSKPGTFTYHDPLHTYAYTGSVIVR